MQQCPLPWAEFKASRSKVGGGVTVGKMQMQGVKFAVSVEQCKYCEGGAGPNFSQGELQFCKAPPPVI